MIDLLLQIACGVFLVGVLLGGIVLWLEETFAPKSNGSDWPAKDPTV